MDSLGSEAIVTPASESHNAALIFLHGRGDTGHGWHKILSNMCAPNIKVICPNAPTRPISFYGMQQMPSWFDKRSSNFYVDEDKEGIVNAFQGVQKIIDQEVAKGIPSDRIVIGGFSQGGAVALYTFLNFNRKLGGCAALSTWLPLQQEIQSFKEVNYGSEVFLAHGDADKVVDFKYGIRTKQLLEDRSFNLIWKEYKGLGHSSSPQEMRDLAEYLKYVVDSSVSMKSLN